MSISEKHLIKSAIRGVPLLSPAIDINGERAKIVGMQSQGDRIWLSRKQTTKLRRRMKIKVPISESTSANFVIDEENIHVLVVHSHFDCIQSNCKRREPHVHGFFSSLHS